MSCSACEIHPEGAFESAGEDLELEKMLADHAVLTTIPDPADWPKYGLVERFFQCSQCGEKWYYAQSDFPYRGCWSKLEQE
jgi:hypothetical protein